MTLLVAYASFEWPVRRTIADYLRAFEKHSGMRCDYVNIATPWARQLVRRLKPELVVFTPTLLSERWNPTWDRIVRRLEPVIGMSAHKVIAPQDEYLRPDRICEFVDRFGIDTVLSLAAPTQWPTLYGPILDRVHIHRVLPGYVESAGPLPTASSDDDRETDISYRAWRSAAWTGRHGQLKVEIGERVRLAATAIGLSTDISNSPRDVLLGEAWTRLLASSRWVLGTEGGSSLLDRDGTLRTRVDAFTARHPDASFEEIEAACFPGLDGNLDYRAISPRHFEAAALRTGQILVRGDYNGLMIPGVHYLALEPDFTNLDEVLRAARDEGLRRQIVERAHLDLVRSGVNSYQQFVQDILTWTGMDPSASSRGTKIGAAAVRLLDRLSWPWVGLRSRVRRRLLLPLRRRRMALAGRAIAGSR
jgi:hypothetical protein